MLLINPPEPVCNPTGVANADVVNTFLQEVQPPVCSKVNTRKNQHTGTWADERIELLKKLWADGLSASQIAAEMGGTRNGILGKVWRLKLSRPRPIRAEKLKKPAATPRQWKRGVKIAPHVESVDVIPPEQLRELLDLTNTQCHWPVGDGPFLFCAAEKSRGSYCAHHHARAYGAER